MVDPHLADTYTAADTILALSEIGLYYFWSVNADQDPLVTFHSDKIVQTGSTTFDVPGLGSADLTKIDVRGVPIKEAMFEYEVFWKNQMPESQTQS